MFCKIFNLQVICKLIYGVSTKRSEIITSHAVLCCGTGPNNWCLQNMVCSFDEMIPLTSISCFSSLSVVRPQCESQVKGFNGAVYKKFKTNDEAEEFVRDRGNSSLVLVRCHQFFFHQKTETINKRCLPPATESCIINSSNETVITRCRQISDSSEEIQNRYGPDRCVHRKHCENDSSRQI